MTIPIRNLSTVWGNDSVKPTFKSLVRDLEVDVAIVGGGITGITAAYHLSKAGKNVVVLEASEVGKGTTGFSTGNLYAPVDTRLFTLEEKHGDEKLKKVVTSRIAAIDFIEARVKEFDIECDFQRVPWHLFSSSEDGNGSGEIEKEFRAASKAGLEVTTHTPKGFPMAATQIITIPHQAQFDPLVYTRELASKIAATSCQIFENTPVIDVSDKNPCVLKTQHGTVRAQKVIMATHTP